jgi:hypothetical protein
MVSGMTYHNAHYGTYTPRIFMMGQRPNGLSNRRAAFLSILGARDRATVGAGPGAGTFGPVFLRTTGGIR